MKRRLPNQASIEEIQPQSIRRPAPVWIFIALLMLLYGAMVYFDQASGWFSQQIYGPYHNLAELEKWQPAVSHRPFYVGRAGFNKTTFVACSQPDWKGTPGQIP